MPGSRLTFDSPAMLIVAAVLAAIVIVIAWRRRLALPRASLALGAAGLAMLVLAAGLPHWRRAVATEVAVLVDLSPSTRSAAFRDRAAVERRARELLGDVPFRLYRFADGEPAAADGPGVGGPGVVGPGADDWAELPTPFTRYRAPAAARVLLFSDGRFDLPSSAPPTYAVVDGQLAMATDGRVSALTIDGPDAVASVAVDTPRSLTWTVGDRVSDRPVLLTIGTAVLRQSVAPSRNAHGSAVGPTAERWAWDAGPIVARLSSGDLWPENDALTIHPPPPPRAERWFVTTASTSPEGYRRLSPGELPADAAAWLAASAVVLDNVPTPALSLAAADRLTQFVRDLGGGLMIVGGDSAFAAGGYVGTPIDALSPLASTPPRPATHWVLLTDGSGSMNTPIGDAGPRTRWQSAADALVRLVPSLPPDDPVDLGSFAADVTWWTGSAGRPAKDVRTLSLPPAGVSPGGPTNLRPAIEAAARRHDPALPANLLLLSDADAEVGDVASLVELLKSRNVKLHLLAVGDGRGLADLRQVVERTGGTVVAQRDADRWADAAGELLKSARERHLVAEAATVRYLDQLAAIGSRRVSPWNRTWLKLRATLLAETDRPAGLTDDDAPVPLAAIWQAGQGKVAAVGFATNAAERSAVVDLVSAAARDPRFAVTVETNRDETAWAESGGRLTVRVDAVDPNAPPAGQYLNGLSLSLELSPVGGGSPVLVTPIPQVAPGRYELKVDAPMRPMLATVREGTSGRVIDRLAVAGRYPREFDAIGIDRQNLQRLVDRFGGAVIEPAQTTPIDFKWPLQATPIAPWLAAAGAVLLAAGLLWWRWA